jgi:hypothetical protein
METAIALIVGFALGYGVREWVSRRRREAERRRRALWGRRPPGRNLVVGRYCSGVSLMTRRWQGTGMLPFHKPKIDALQLRVGFAVV